MNLPRLPFSAGCLLFCLLPALAGIGLFAPGASGAFLAKRFTVLKDNGKDVLCDPYVVRKDDWVTKLFKQRGEISEKDFPEFLEIFSRLNPDVTDVNLIYPGQRILIPLKILAPNSLEGQATGSVIIPVITITNIPAKLKDDSAVHVVQEGDTVSGLLMRDFGPVNSRSYKEAFKIFEYINPEVKDPDRIRVGQKLNLPDPAVQDRDWYADLFNASGELTIRAEKREAPGPGAEKKPGPVAAPGEIAPIESALDLEELKPISTSAPPPSVDEVGPILPFAYEKAAAILGADLLDKGEYFFPRQGQKDLRVDLSITPVMEFHGGLKLLFARKPLPGPDLMAIHAFWKTIRSVTVGENPSVRDLLDRACPAIHRGGVENRITLTDQFITVDVRGQYIYDTPGRPGKTVLTLIDSPGEAVPDIIGRYLRRHQVIINEWVSRKDVLVPISTDSTPHPVSSPETVFLNAADSAGFVRDLLSLLGFSYQENVEVSFPYAGFQVTAQSNLLSFARGREYLIDFGSFQGDAVRSLQSAGFKVIEIKSGDTPDAVLAALVPVLPVHRTDSPVFFAAKRPRIYNPSVNIPGTLITSADESRGVLIVSVPLDPDITTFLEQSGTRVIRFETAL